MKIIIAGAGIGGLTTALCLLRRGHEVVVLEKAAELGDVGAGIQLSPNAMKVYGALGIDDLLAAKAFRPERIETRMGRSGRYVFTIPLAEQAIKKWGAPYLHLYRPDLIEALKRGLERKGHANIIRFGQTVTGYTQDAEAITVRGQSGGTVTGDVLIGADGIHSPVRAQMLGDEKAKFTGNVAWRAVVPVDQLGDLAPAPTACAWMGPGRHAVTYRLRGGTLANLVAVVETDQWTTESWTEKGTTQEALSDFEGWHPVITNMIKNAGTLYRWALFDRPPFKTWTDGRAALLGDAAHPMLPFVAQGAGMAAEDGWVIARCLSDPNGDIPAALKAYEQARFARTSYVQARALGNAKTFHQRTWAGQLTTYGPMWLAGKLAPGLIHKVMDPIYKFDVTRDA